jgi:6-pyruvoyltetrahydropterin/6-carboxytetrahydropterin synthase
MHEITKQFDFCYGHRVWSQTLNPTYSLDTCLKCRHLHGHQGTVLITLEAETLTDGMVTDFKHLNFFKKWLDDTLDHKFIMDLNDPVRETQFKLSINKIVDQSTHWVIEEQFLSMLKGPTREIYEGLVFVDFVPTSENISKWIFGIVQEKMLPLGVKVSKVTLYETPKSQSTYYNLIKN